MSKLPFEVDVPGRMQNLRLAPYKAIHTLYEAVVNSMHAVLDGPQTKSGRVDITVIRKPPLPTLNGGKSPGRLTGFEISDNGIGFDDANFKSFIRTDSTAKAKYGGRGVGRLLWLKVFQTISVESVYGKGKTRLSRTFGVSPEGILDLKEAPSEAQRQTKVTLRDPVAYYADALQHEPETIALNVIEHCLEYFITEKRAEVFLIDDQFGYAAELGKMFQNDLRSEIKREKFSLAGFDFEMTHLLVRGRKNSRHGISYCADARRVHEEPLSGRIPGLHGPLRMPDFEDDLTYHGYVAGKLLNRWVVADRTSFDFDGLFFYDPERPPQETLSGEDLTAAAVAKAAKFLDHILEPILKANNERVRKRVEEEMPQYRHLLTYRADDVAAIAPSVEGRELDLALYKIEQKFDGEAREEIVKLQGPQDPDLTPAIRLAKLEKLLKQLNESGKSKLVRHVLYRHALIECLEDQVVLDKDGKYSKEDVLHAAICPRHTTSDDTPPSEVNLWLLDDRLYFHYFLASDLPLKQYKELLKRESKDRPDLAIFNRPMAFSDSTSEIGSVILVEFKRPVRDDYKKNTPHRDPDAQILDYLETLRDGRALDARGGHVTISADTPFYAYIIADLTPSLRKIAKRAGFRTTPDGEGYFKFHENFNCYAEIISFGKMIRDAKKRNAAFFHQLGIPIPGKR